MTDQPKRRMRITKAIARWLRNLADRIDYSGAPKRIGWTFTFERCEGIVFRQDGRGCRLWYLGDSDYERAHTEADRAPEWPDLRAL